MRILFTRFPLESAHGGAEIQILSLMKGLIERGHAVAFLGSCPVLLQETAKLHIPHAKLDIGPPPVTKWGAISFLWRKQKMKERLALALTSFDRIDAIVMISLSEKLLLTEVASRRGIRAFWLEHDRVGRWLTKNPWLSTLRKLSVTAITICVSELSKKIFVGLGWNAEKVVAIPNGIDLQRFAGTGSGSGSEIHIGCVSRLSEEKGVDVLIQAVSQLPRARLTIVGSGPDEGYLHKLIHSIQSAEMTNEGRMRIISKTDLGSFYRSIDMLVLPSRDNDPFGLVAAEAMSVGTPVIVTDQCGIADYLTNGKDALIVKADSPEALVQAISRLSDAETRERMGAEGKKTAHDKFSAERMVDAYDALISSSSGIR